MKIGKSFKNGVKVIIIPLATLIPKSFSDKIRVGLAGALLIAGGYTANAQSTTDTTKPQTEQFQLTDDPKAKADVAMLKQKYGITTNDDIWGLDIESIVNLWGDIINGLGASMSSSYHNDRNLVKFRDEVAEVVEAVDSDHYDATYPTIVGRGKKLAKTDEKLAKSQKELEETIAFGEAYGLTTEVKGSSK